MSVPVECPNCGRAARLRDPARLGRKTRCRACGESFVLVAAPPRRRRPGRSRATERAGGFPTWGWAAGAAGLAAAVGFLLMATDGDDTASPAPGAPTASAPAVADAAPAAAGPGASEPAAAEPTPEPAVPRADLEARAAELGIRFAELARAGDSAALAALWDPPAQFRRAIGGMDLTPSAERRVRETMGLYRNSAAVLAAEYADRDVAVRYLHPLGVDGEPAALVRVGRPFKDRGGDYLLLVPSPPGTGEPRIAEFVRLSGAESLTEQTRRFYAAELDGTGGAMRREARSNAFRTAAAGGKAEQALTLYDGLTEDDRSERVVQFWRLVAATAAGGDRYREAFADARARFPDDPTILQVEVRTALRAATPEDPGVDRLERAVAEMDDALGGDPSLQIWRAGLLANAGRHAEALDLARRARDAEPDSERGVLRAPLRRARRG